MRIMLRFFILYLIIFSPVTNSYANDSAAAIGVSGLLLKDEKRVVIEKELLMIKANHVTVDYTFRNLSEEKITTLVAFPIAPFIPYDMEDYDQGFNFKVIVDHKEVPIQADVRSFVGLHDITNLLEKAGISHKAHEIRSNGQLNTSVLDELMDIGALRSGAFGEYNKDTYYSMWENHVSYYWNQVFLPNAVVHIRHEYDPSRGYGLFENIDDFMKTYSNSCITAEVQKAIDDSHQRLKNDKRVVDTFLRGAWVNYILTTANNWHQPIRDFELIIEKKNPNEYVAFCWDGEIERLSDVRLRAHKKDFKPDKDLVIYFFYLPPNN